MEIVNQLMIGLLNPPMDEAKICEFLLTKYIKSNNFAFMEQVIPEDWTVMTHLKEKEFMNEMKRSIERSWKILALYLRWLTFEWNCETQTEAEISSLPIQGMELSLLHIKHF
jgi:hypothetical protein